MTSRDPKVTPITRNEPRTFYATRLARTITGEVWDLWTVADGRRIGFLSVVDDGEIFYGLAAVKKGTDHRELMDLFDGLYPPQANEEVRQEFMIVEYEGEPQVYDMGV